MTLLSWQEPVQLPPWSDLNIHLTIKHTAIEWQNNLYHLQFSHSINLRLEKHSDKLLWIASTTSMYTEKITTPNHPVFQTYYAVLAAPTVPTVPALRRSLNRTGTIVNTTETLTTIAWIPKTRPNPFRWIQAGWKYPTANPPQVRHILRMADTQVDRLGYFSKEYAVIALVRVSICQKHPT